MVELDFFWDLLCGGLVELKIVVRSTCLWLMMTAQC